MLSGTSSSRPVWCQPGVTCVLISWRCRFMHSVLAVGAMIAAPTARSRADVLDADPGSIFNAD